jgi:hypothetical protein
MTEESAVAPESWAFSEGRCADHRNCSMHTERQRSQIHFESIKILSTIS